MGRIVGSRRAAVRGSTSDWRSMACTPANGPRRMPSAWLPSPPPSAGLLDNQCLGVDRHRHCSSSCGSHCHSVLQSQGQRRPKWGAQCRPRRRPVLTVTIPSRCIVLNPLQTNLLQTYSAARSVCLRWKARLCFSRLGHSLRRAHIHGFCLAAILHFVICVEQLCTYLCATLAPAESIWHCFGKAAANMSGHSSRHAPRHGARCVVPPPKERPHTAPATAIS